MRKRPKIHHPPPERKPSPRAVDLAEVFFPQDAVPIDDVVAKEMRALGASQADIEDARTDGALWSLSRRSLIFPPEIELG